VKIAQYRYTDAVAGGWPPGNREFIGLVTKAPGLNENTPGQKHEDGEGEYSNQGSEAHRVSSAGSGRVGLSFVNSAHASAA
jgi:hypothetical protein